MSAFRHVTKPRKDPVSGRRNGVHRVIVSITMALGMYTLVHSCLGQLTVVHGISMRPTLKSGQVLVTEKVSLFFAPPHPGQIVVCHPPIPSPQDFVKRVIAVGGQSVAARNGTIYINGRPQAEPFVKYRGDVTFPAYKVPRGEIFVMGDNRPVSEDSRFFGVIPLSSVVGVVIGRLWPPGVIQLPMPQKRLVTR